MTTHWVEKLGGFTDTENLKAILGAYTAAAPLKPDVDAVLADTIQIADGALPASPASNSLARFIASGGTALGTPLPASKSLYDVIALDRLDHATYGLSALDEDLGTIITRVGDPTAHTLTTLTAKLGNLSEDLATILEAFVAAETGGLGDRIAFLQQFVGKGTGTVLPADKALYDVIALDRLDKQHAGTHKTHPLLADPITLASSATAWTYGGYVEIVAASAITADFWITGIEVSNPSAADNYVVGIATGAALSEVDIIEVPVTRTDVTAAGVITSVIIPVNPPVKVAANTRISGKSASKATAANTIDAKIMYATGLR